MATMKSNFGYNLHNFRHCKVKHFKDDFFDVCWSNGKGSLESGRWLRNVFAQCCQVVNGVNGKKNPDIFMCVILRVICDMF